MNWSMEPQLYYAVEVERSPSRKNPTTASFQGSVFLSCPSNAMTDLRPAGPASHTHISHSVRHISPSRPTVFALGLNVVGAGGAESPFKEKKTHEALALSFRKDTHQEAVPSTPCACYPIAPPQVLRAFANYHRSRVRASDNDPPSAE